MHIYYGYKIFVKSVDRDVMRGALGILCRELCGINFALKQSYK